MKVTKHGKRRIKEGCGVGKKRSNSAAYRAFNKGIKRLETSGNLRRWLDGIYFSKQTANNIRLYNHKCYLFCGESLVTILDIPKNLIEEYESIDTKTKNKNNTKEVYKITLYHPKSIGYTVTTVKNDPFTETIVDRFGYGEYYEANDCAATLYNESDQQDYDCIRIINDRSYDIGDDISDSTYRKYY